MEPMNRRIAGRIGTGALFGLAALLIVFLLGFFLSSRQSITASAASFMSALAKADTAALSDLTYLGSDDKAAIESKWKKTFERSAGYAFTWRIVSSTTGPEGKSGAVRLQVTRNADKPGGYEEKFELPMVMRDGKWKVEVDGISREMFPFLPRPSGG